MGLPTVRELVEWLEAPEQEVIDRFESMKPIRNSYYNHIEDLCPAHRRLAARVQEWWPDPNKVITVKEHGDLAQDKEEKLTMQLSFDHWFMVPATLEEIQQRYIDEYGPWEEWRKKNPDAHCCIRW